MDNFGIVGSFATYSNYRLEQSCGSNGLTSKISDSQCKYPNCGPGLLCHNRIEGYPEKCPVALSITNKLPLIKILNTYQDICLIVRKRPPNLQKKIFAMLQGAKVNQSFPIFIINRELLDGDFLDESLFEEIDCNYL